MARNWITRNLILVLIGVAGLLLKPHRGPWQELVSSQGGNFAVSFALYFILLTAASRHGFGRHAAAVAALLAVEVFEVTDGFGVMSNTYDPLDLLANAAGVCTAFAVDLVSSPWLKGG